MRTNILGTGIDAVNRKEALSEALNHINSNERLCRVIITPNPEVVMSAKNDTGLSEIISKADLVIPDGVGVVWASKYSKIRLTETVPGCDLCHEIFDNIKGTGKKAYLLGGKPGVAEQAKKNMEGKYPGLEICGYHNGYFDENEEKLIIEEINVQKPDVLLVGLGSPRQEKWMINNQKNLPVNIAIGCGGTIDIMAGSVKRAPLIFRKAGLEWFYRLITQPSRFFRMLKLPQFVFAVILDYIKNGC